MQNELTNPPTYLPTAVLPEESDWLSLGHVGVGPVIDSPRLRLNEKLCPLKRYSFQNKGRNAGPSKTVDIYFTAKSGLHLIRGFQRSQTERCDIIMSPSAHIRCWELITISSFPLLYL